MKAPQHIADSVLNRILNFVDDLNAPMPKLAGAVIDAKLAEPALPADPAASPELADAMISDGLGLQPPPMR
jgi:hypothetical protein